MDQNTSASPVRYWRVRMKVQGWLDHSEAAWDRGEIGLWYGAWSASDWLNAIKASPHDPWALLRSLPHQQALGWEFRPDVGAMLRFQKIAPSDWVVIYLKDRAELGLARLEPEIHSDGQHPLNQPADNEGIELFKYRRIKEQKTFKVAKLPDAYLLLAAQGRGNVHEFHGMRSHVQLLAKSTDANAVKKSLDSLSFESLIDFSGASVWESICTAYLTLEHHFVPTGLSVGRTLSDFDIVGRRVPDGMRIYAQCKKNPNPVLIDPNYASAIHDSESQALIFYFAYGGYSGALPLGVEFIGRAELLEWVQTERGAMYRNFLVGG